MAETSEGGGRNRAWSVTVLRGTEGRVHGRVRLLGAPGARCHAWTGAMMAVAATVSMAATASHDGGGGGNYVGGIKVRGEGFWPGAHHGGARRPGE